MICRSAKEYVHGEVHEEMLTQTFSVFEPEQCLEIGNYKYSFDRNFIILWQMELVCFLFILFFLVHPVHSKFWLCDREMKSVNAV